MTASRASQGERLEFITLLSLQPILCLPEGKQLAGGLRTRMGGCSVTDTKQVMTWPQQHSTRHLVVQYAKRRGIHSLTSQQGNSLD